MAKEPLRGRVGDVASKETELRRGSGDIVASKETDGRRRSGVFWSRDRGGEPTDMSAGCAAVATASTAWGVTIGTLSAGLEMEPRRRGDLIIYLCMYASSKSRRSLAVARGPITRVALAPRINNPATKVRWVIILKRGAYCCGTLVRHPQGKASFPAGPAPSVESGPARVSGA
jgi:hypothetical protein